MHVSNKREWGRAHRRAGSDRLDLIWARQGEVSHTMGHLPFSLACGRGAHAGRADTLSLSWQTRPEQWEAAAREGGVSGSRPPSLELALSSAASSSAPFLAAASLKPRELNIMPQQLPEVVQHQGRMVIASQHRAQPRRWLWAAPAAAGDSTTADATTKRAMTGCHVRCSLVHKRCLACCLRGGCAHLLARPSGYTTS